MSAEHETEDNRDPVLMALYDVWSERRAVLGAMPPRTEIDPVEIPPKTLPHVVLVDVEPGPRFRFRLVGTYTASGVDPTGTYLDEASPHGLYRDHILDLYRSPLDLAGPTYTISHYLTAGGIFNRSTHRVFMPLAGQGGETECLLIGQRTQDGMPYQGSLWEIVPSLIEVKCKTRLP